VSSVPYLLAFTSTAAHHPPIHRSNPQPTRSGRRCSSILNYVVAFVTYCVTLKYGYLSPERTLRSRMRGALVQRSSQRALWRVLVEFVNTSRSEKCSEIVSDFEMKGIIRHYGPARWYSACRRPRIQSVKCSKSFVMHDVVRDVEAERQRKTVVEQFQPSRSSLRHHTRLAPDVEGVKKMSRSCTPPNRTPNFTWKVRGMLARHTSPVADEERGVIVCAFICASIAHTHRRSPRPSWEARLWAR
jgi:hypothetical protein